MRIAVYTPNTGYGGSEVYTIQMVRDLVSAGHEVLALTHPECGRNLLRDGIIATGATLYDVGVTTGGHFTARDLVEPVERFAAHRALFVLSGISWQRAAVRALRRLTMPVTAVVQLTLAEQVDCYASYKDMLTAPNVRLVAVSHENAKHLRQALGVDVRVIWNGADPATESPAERRAIRERLRGELGVPLRARVVLTVARISAAKGVGSWIEAALRICRRRDDVHFVWSGDDYLHSVVDEARSRAPHERIHFLGHRDDVGALLHAADLFCLPSRAEGLPLALAEAKAHSVPAIVSAAAGGHSEVVRHTETGLLHELTEDDLEEKLVWALDHPDSMREMAARAHAEGLLDGPRLRAETIALLVS